VTAFVLTGGVVARVVAVFVPFVAACLDALYCSPTSFESAETSKALVKSRRRVRRVTVTVSSTSACKVLVVLTVEVDSAKRRRRRVKIGMVEIERSFTQR